MAERIKFSVKKNNSFFLNDSDREVLLFLYMPVIGIRGYIIYNLFYSLTGATGKYVGDPLLLTDYLCDFDITDKELNNSLKILRDFKLLRMESTTEFTLFRPMSKEKFRESMAYSELLDNVSIIEKKAIMEKFGFTKAVLDYKRLEYNKEKKVSREFDIDRFKSDTRDAGYIVIDSDLLRIEALARIFVLSYDECLRFFYESSPEDGMYNIEEMVVKSYKYYSDKKEKESRIANLKGNDDTEHIKYFEKLTPIELLRDNMHGIVVPEADVSLVNELRDKLCLSDPMINILLGYSIATNEGKIKPYQFFETIVLDWKKHKIKTVEDAYYYITDLYSKTKKGTKKGKKSSAEEWFNNYWESYMKEKEGKK